MRVAANSLAFDSVNADLESPCVAAIHRQTILRIHIFQFFAFTAAFAPSIRIKIFETLFFALFSREIRRPSDLFQTVSDPEYVQLSALIT